MSHVDAQGSGTLARLKELAEAATPGPWRAVDYERDPAGSPARLNDEGFRTVRRHASTCEWDYIAACDPTTILALIAETAGLQREIDEALQLSGGPATLRELVAAAAEQQVKLSDAMNTIVGLGEQVERLRNKAPMVHTGGPCECCGQPEGSRCTCFANTDSDLEVMRCRRFLERLIDDIGAVASNGSVAGAVQQSIKLFLEPQPRTVAVSETE